MRRLLDKLILCAVYLASSPALAAQLATASSSGAYVIAVPPVMGSESAVARWMHIATFLEQEIPGTDFAIHPLPPDEVIAAAERGQIDFLIHDPLMTRLVLDSGLGRPIATLQPLSSEQSTRHFGGATTFGTENDRIHERADLRGARVAAVGELSFGGWLVAREELADRGIHETDLGSRQFTGLPRSNVVENALSGDVGEGTIRMGVLERLIRDGRIEEGALRVLEPVDDPVFPEARSTPLYPEFSASAMRHVSEDVVKAVAIALLRMPSDHPSAITAKVHGWSAGFESAGISTLLRSLRPRPYEGVTLPPKSEQPAKHPITPLVLVAVALLSLGFGGYLVHQNRRLRAVALELSSLEMRLQAFVEHTPAAVAMVDMDMRYLIASWGWLDQYELPMESIVGKTHYEVFPTIPERWKEIHRRCLAGESMSCDRDPFDREDGGTTWVRWRIEPWTNSAGEMGGIIMFCEVIDQQIEYERSLEEATRRANAVTDQLLEAQQIGQIGSWTYDLASEELAWSDMIYTISETDREQFGASYEDFEAVVHPDDRERVRAAYTRSIENQEPYNIVHRLLMSDGRVKYVHERCETIYDDDGKPLRSMGTMQDITNETLVQMELDQLKERYEFAIAGSTDGLWDVDERTGAFWASAQFNRMLGFDPDSEHDLIKDRDGFWELVHPDDRESTAEAVRQLLENDVPYDVDYRLLCQNDGYRWFRARGRTVRDEQGRPVRSSGSLTDIHESRYVENRLRLAARIAQLGPWDWDIENGNTFFNELYYENLGYTAADWVDDVSSWSNLLHPEDAEQAFADVQRHIAGETDTYVNEHRLRCKDGSWRWVRAHGEIVDWLLDGSPKRMIGMSLDIQDLRDMVEHSESASRAKSEFLANMSHEIRTPLTAVIGYADVLAEELGSDNDEATKTVQRIQASSQHLLSVINDILDVSRIEAGKMTVEIMKLPPAQIVEETASLVGSRAHAKGVDVSVCYDTPIPAEIESDPTRLRQILLNIAGNAVKFTDKGSVTIRVSCEPELERIQFSVVDTGAGLTPEQVDKLSKFEPFTQADYSVTRKHGGSGHGLRISRELASLLGGSISIESEPDQGTVVSVVVSTGQLHGVDLIEPAAISAGVPDSKALPTAQADGKPLEGVRILLAEDGLDNQRLISHFLKKAGAQVVVCENGQEAVDCLSSADDGEPVAVVLMDMQMPVLDGYGAARRLRKLGYNLPIIAVTAYAMDGDQEKCLSAGCDDYTTKPINKSKLIEKCVMWSKRRRSRRGAA